MKEYYLIDTDVTLSEKIDNDTVVINLNTGCYYNFNPTASYIWELIGSGQGKDNIKSIYMKTFNIAGKTADNDVSEIIATLLSMTLIRQSTGNSPALEMNSVTSPYVKPEIEEFNDMQEMLLLDPIHEVTEKGWPYKKDEQ